MENDVSDVHPTSFCVVWISTEGITGRHTRSFLLDSRFDKVCYFLDLIIALYMVDLSDCFVGHLQVFVVFLH
jgi:hypothetical protein